MLFILAGSVGLGAIVVESGIADKISDAITAISAGSLIAVVITLAVSTALLTNITTNAAAASILTPRPDPGPGSRCQPGDDPGADRHMHLLHVHQPLQSPVQPDGDAARALQHEVLREVRDPVGRVSLVSVIAVSYCGADVGPATWTSGVRIGDATA